MSRTIVLASDNAGKLREMDQLLRPLGIEIVAQGHYGVRTPAEIGSTFADNAVLKARHAAQHTRFAAIADDSGLEVDALGGAPGVHSARYAGDGANDGANVDKLLTALRDVPEPDRTARFQCVAAFVRAADDPEPVIAYGTWSGRVAAAARGANGFGYDPVFFLPERGCTSAELAPEEKNRLSHRGQALRALVRALRELQRP
jgi:XTP/dITP diphosphohydrolase